MKNELETLISSEKDLLYTNTLYTDIERRQKNIDGHELIKKENSKIEDLSRRANKLREECDKRISEWVWKKADARKAFNMKSNIKRLVHHQVAKIKGSVDNTLNKIKEKLTKEERIRFEELDSLLV